MTVLLLLLAWLLVSVPVSLVVARALGRRPEAPPAPVRTAPEWSRERAAAA